MRHKSRFEKEESKLRFYQVLFAVVLRRYNVALDASSAPDFIKLLGSLSAPEKKQFWSDFAATLGEDRSKAYKYYNNTYKPFIMPKFPEDLLEHFGAIARQITFAMLKTDAGMGKDHLIREAMRRVKAAVEFAQYEDKYHPDAAYHKIRNAILSALRCWAAGERREMSYKHRKAADQLVSCQLARQPKNNLEVRIFQMMQQDTDSETEPCVVGSWPATLFSYGQDATRERAPSPNMLQEISSECHIELMTFE